MEIETSEKVRLVQMETFIDIWSSTSYGFDIRLYPGLSYFAIIKFKKDIDMRLLVYPDLSWFDEWLSGLEEKPKIIFQTGKIIKMEKK
jgi:hypothetical protein